MLQIEVAESEEPELTEEERNKQLEEFKEKLKVSNNQNVVLIEESDDEAEKTYNI